VFCQVRQPRKGMKKIGNIKYLSLLSAHEFIR
jgi:hypothetical protein